MAATLRLIAFALGMTGAVTAHAADEAGAALEAGRARWQAAALADYEYGYHKYCDCYGQSPPETLVTVRAGKVERVRHRRAGYPNEVPAEDRNVQYYWTVDELFDLVSSALDGSATVRVEYDAALGFPTLLFVDYDADLIGDELDLRLTRVAPLDR